MDIDRIFYRVSEIAKDHFNLVNNVCVLGGIISPVNDGYAKKDLIPGNYRYAMVQLALKTSNWIKASDWEISREGWTKTRYSLQYHQVTRTSHIKVLFVLDDVMH